MNISSTPPKYIMYIYIYVYYSSDSGVSVQFLYSLCTTMSFWPFDIPQRGIQSMFRYLQDFRVSSEFLQNTAELRWKLLWYLKWTSAPNPSLLWRTLPFNVPQRSLVRFLLLHQRLIRTGFRRHLALVMATVSQTFGGSATHLNNWWLEPSLVYYQS